MAEFRRFSACRMFAGVSLANFFAPKIIQNSAHFKVEEF